ncbi:hypothetical protein GE061_018862 [Apolygus lucorum]|uniref:Sec16 Sec23-binding domain-containing protein n=1 Tax=Apolygus lucorum TaxID=248454 RepID=A0A6A4JPG6_APOLU|nr:hypothetical protein GE061_018862 [Apolygus lucorum]
MTHANHPHPNGSVPQVPRQHQQHPQQHYNNPNIFATGKGGADFFDSLVANNANTIPSGWGQQGVWAAQPPPVHHQSTENQIETENNEIVPPEIDYKRPSFTSGFTNAHFEKNANFTSANTFHQDSANLNASLGSQLNPPPQSQTRSISGSQDVHDVRVAQNWDSWNEVPSSKESAPPPLPLRRAPDGPQSQTYDDRQAPNMHQNHGFLPPPPVSSAIPPSDFHGNANVHSFATPNQVPAKPLGQTMTTDVPSNRPQPSPHSMETNNAVQQPPKNHQSQAPSAFGSLDSWNKDLNSENRQHLPPPSKPDSSAAKNLQHPFSTPLEIATGNSFQNQPLPPLESNPKQKSLFPEVASAKTNNQLFNTPETRNNNPFLTPSSVSHEESLSLLPIGSSTPTGMPYKPENEEVPPKQDTLEHQMTNLTIEESLPTVVTQSLEVNKSEPTNQEAPVEKEQTSAGLLVADRNQYLETGHLSALKDVEDLSLQDLADESDAPPPGLDRMVTGQLREPITTPSDLGRDVDLQSMNSNAPTVGSLALGESSASSVVSEGRKGGSMEGTEDEPESQRLVQGESTAEEQQFMVGPPGHREVPPGEAEPVRGRVVLGQMGRSNTPPLLQDQPSPRNDRERGEREIVGRMVVGERTEPPQSSAQDEYRQQHRPRHRHPRGESSFDEEERDYSSDRDRRERDRGDFKRDERPRRRHRSPEYRSDEEYEDKRPYPRGNRERDRRDRDRRDRDYSPDREYYYNRDYYHDSRDRRPRRYGDRERDYHHREREYEDDYYYRDHRSRPSSRTGSDYRRLNVSNDYAARSRHYYPDNRLNVTLPALKDVTKTNQSSMMMNSSMNSTGFPDYSKLTNDPRAYGEYLETMRRVDPAGYAVWYNNYMATRYGMHQSGTFNNDRASVHSGQSSSNQRQAVQSPTAAVDEDKEEDYTPRLYTTAHVRGTIDNYGRLLVVDPNYPMDGQRASLSLYQMNCLPLPDADTEEFLETPGPFIPGITHRSTVLHYLKRMSQLSQKNSEKLLYDLIHLIVKGNGEINGCDISELLMNSFKKCSYDEERRDCAGDGAISQNEVVTRFRELLIQGNKLEALEWAIENGSWGHALFLSSKMDHRTHKDVMFRFMDSISQNDPIRTLYQMMSGHIPHASECCGDKQWSDWRPHLAMILGNPTSNSKIDRKSIIRLGDALSAKGRIFAAHFCYITAQVEVTAYKPSAKLVLLGANSKLDSPLQASCRSIMLTLCYEYGLKLKQIDFSIPSLQLYKLILTTRLIDIGRNKIALQYCQLMALEALQCGNYDRNIMSHVIDLGSRLKMLEPSLALSGDANAELEWLEKLTLHYESLPDDYEGKVELRPSASSSTISEVGQDVPTEQFQHLPLEARNMTATTQPLYDPYVAYNQELTITSDSQPPTFLPPQPQLVNEEQDFNASNVMHPPVQNHYMEPPPVTSSGPPGYAPEQTYWDNGNSGMIVQEHHPAVNNYELSSIPEAPPTPVKSKSNDFFKATEEQLKLGDVTNGSAKQSESQKPNQQQLQQMQAGKGDDQKSGWFGGIFDKLSMRPKNQMKLPDDKNPSIVWDDKKKKWVNLDGESEATSQIKPPPKAFEMGGPVSSAPQGGPLGDSGSMGPSPNFQSHGNGGGQLVQNSGPASLPPASTNKYKLQKGKLMKKNYVDIMSSSKPAGDATQSQPPSLDGYVPLMPQVAQQPTFFTPSRVEGLENAPYDFITPSSAPRLPESSTEEASNAQPQGAAQPPAMYNRSQMQ